MTDTPAIDNRGSIPARARLSGKKALALLLVNIVLLGVLFLLLEVGLRWVGTGHGNAPLEGHAVLHHVHPRDYEFTAYEPRGEYGGHLVYYDANGLRAPVDGVTPAANAVKVAVLGDSFVEATQVSWEESFVGRVQRALGPAAWLRNYGVSSYSPVLGYLAWKTQVVDFAPDIVIYLMYTNDPRGDDEYLKEGVFEGEELVAVPGDGSWLRDVLRRSYAVRFLRRQQLLIRYRLGKKAGAEEERVVGGMVEENPGVTPNTATYLLKLRDRVESTGARLLLATVPSKYDEVHRRPSSQDGFSSQWQAWAQAQSIEFIDAEGHFEATRATGRSQAFFEHDIHLNAAGHRLFAQALLRHLGDGWRPADTSSDARATAGE